MKKRLASVALIVLILALFAYGTTAYINAEGRATNVITTGTVSLSLTEESGDGTPIEDQSGVQTGLMFTNVMPSQTLEKKPIVKNEGSQPFWLRVRVDKSFESGLSTDVITTDMDMTLWTKSGDWYYWNEEVAPGEQITVFEHVTFDKTMGNDYQGKEATITIQAQAVQTANNPIPEGGSITDVAGWPET